MPETLAGVINAVGAVFQAVTEYVVLDLFNTSNLSFLIYIEHKLLALKNAYREIITPNHQLILTIFIPIYKSNSLCVISGNGPKPLFSLLI